MKRYLSLTIAIVCLATICSAGEFRKWGVEDIEWGYGTWTSAGGVTSTRVPYPLSGGDSDNSAIKDVRSYGADNTGVSDSASAITAAMAAVGKGIVFIPQGTYKILSTLTVPAGVTLMGTGFSGETGVAAATKILKSFNGTGIAMSGDYSALVNLQVMGDTGNTGDGIVITGSRVLLDRVLSNAHGQDGIRIGTTSAGASSINANLWQFNHVYSMSNTRHGLYITDTNTTTSATFPAGAANANAGTYTSGDCSSNGGDGIRIANSIDNRFYGVVAQSNTGYGIKLEQYARGNQFHGYYTESNLADVQDVQIDNGAKGNILIGPRSASAYMGTLIVDDDGGNYITSYWVDGDLATGTYNLYTHKKLAVGNLATDATDGADIVGYVSDNGVNVFNIMGGRSGTTGGTLTLQTKRDGDTPVDRLVLNALGEWQIKNIGSNGMMFGKTSADNTTAGLTLYSGGYARIDHVISGTDNTTVSAYYNANGYVGGITISGSETAYGTASDYRLKTNVESLTGAVDRISRVDAHRYNWLNDPYAPKVDGFLAHEIQGIVPNAVMGEKDAVDKDGNPRYQTIDNSKLVPLLWSAVQELSERIKALEAGGCSPEKTVKGE